MLVLWKLRAYSKRISRDITQNLSERQLLMHRIGIGIRSTEILAQETEEEKKENVRKEEEQKEEQTGIKEYT